jgi:hypothetical protein
VVHDWIHNKTAPFLDCANQFCNTRWRRAVLEANAALFSGGTPAPVAPKPAPKPPVKTEAPKPVVVTKVAKAPVKATPTNVSKVAKKAWLRRIRKVAKGHAKTHGVVSIDVLRRWADNNNDHPESPSAWGSIFQTGDWKAVSTMRSTYSSNRSRTVKVWALVAATPVAVTA